LCLFLFITGNIYVYEAENYILPDDINLLADKSIETYTKFHANVKSQTPQYTTMRIPVIDQQLDYLNVTLIGQNLTCAANLHVIPLTVPQTGSWKGIWHTCQLMTELIKANLERYIFTCQCRGSCAQIQICKRPRTIEESSWVLCYIYIPYQSAGT